MITYDSFRPGQVWLDTDGNRIQAHGGSIFYHGDRYYWVGENKEKSQREADIWHWGIRLYSSLDLYNWKAEGIILPAEQTDVTSPLYYKSKIDRPHIIYNDKGDYFVMWIKVMGPKDDNYFIIAKSDTVNGQYQVINPHFRPNGFSVGDFDLYKEESNNSAYVIFERVHSDMVVFTLSEDYMDVKGEYTVHMPEPYPPFVREAPALFKRAGKYYMFTSGTTAKFPNPSKVAVSDSLHGPWEDLGNPHIGSTKTSFDSQISTVFRVRGKGGAELFVAAGDRWLVDLPPDCPDMCEVYESMFNPNKTPMMTWEQIFALTQKNTSIAEYVFLPVEFVDGKPCIRWYDEWKIEDFI